MWTNTVVRKRGLGRPGSPSKGPGLGTYMLAAVIVLAPVVAVIALIALLVSLD